jgi:flagellar motor switch protein FliG
MKSIKLILLAAILISPLAANSARAKDTGTTGAIESVKKTARAQIHAIVDPVFSKYCSDECKLLSIDVDVDVANAESIAPGFDEVDASTRGELEPASAEMKVLIDEKIGPNTRMRVLDLVNRYLETLDYAVKVSTKTARFPSPAESATKVADLREKITRQYKSAIEEIIARYCPKDCMLTDYELQTELVNAEEAGYGSAGEYFETGGVAIRVKTVGATLLMEEAIPDGDRANLLEMARLKVNGFKNSDLRVKTMKFPRIGNETSEYAGMATYLGADGKTYGKTSNRESKESMESTRTENHQNSSQSNSNSDSKYASSSEANNRSTNSNNETNSRSNNESNMTKDQKTENYQRFEKIERVENGDALATEFKTMRTFASIFAAIILGLLAFIAFSTLRSKTTIETKGIPMGAGAMPPLPSSRSEESTHTNLHPDGSSAPTGQSNVGRRYEIERLRDELMGIYAEQPRVAKYVFGRVLTEEGIETASGYLSIFGESVVLDLLRDPSLQHDMNELMEFYARTPIELDDSEKLDLLKKLHHRTVAGKMAVVASRSSAQFEYLAEMDGMQIMELVRNESLTVKAIVLTQCDNQKRGAIFSAIDEATKLKLLSELSRIDYLPRDYIQNVATALKRKRMENPRLNTEALPGSEVLVNLLERSEPTVQHSVMKNLEMNNPESARVVKHKLVSIDTLGFLPDGQLLEVILSLRHDELLNFLKGCREDIRGAIFAKCPRDLVSDLEEELAVMQNPSRDIYGALERKVLNRVKMMAQDTLVNLADVNDRLFAAYGNVANIRKAS